MQEAIKIAATLRRKYFFSHSHLLHREGGKRTRAKQCPITSKIIPSSIIYVTRSSHFFHVVLTRDYIGDAEWPRSRRISFMHISGFRKSHFGDTRQQV